MDFAMNIRAFVSNAHPSHASWLLWVEQENESDGAGRLWAGRVKLDDDPVATTYCVLDDALKKTESSLGGGWTPPLF